MTDTTTSTRSAVYVFEDSDDSQYSYSATRPSRLSMEPPRVICVPPEPVPYAQLYIRHVKGAKPHVFVTMVPTGYLLDEFPHTDSASPTSLVTEDGENWATAWNSTPIDQTDLAGPSSASHKSSTSSSSSSNAGKVSQQNDFHNDSAKYESMQFDLVTHHVGDANVWLLGDQPDALPHARTGVMPDTPTCGGCLLAPLSFQRPRRFRTPRSNLKEQSLPSRPKPKGSGGKLQYSNLY